MIFSGSTFLGCTFLNSSITHTNFNGSVLRDCDASGSDLYYSSFAHAHIHNTKMEDCNVRKADFRHTLQYNLSFRWSNYREVLVGSESLSVVGFCNTYNQDNAQRMLFSSIPVMRILN